MLTGIVETVSSAPTLALLEFDVGGFLTGPEFLSVFAGLIVSILTGIVGAFLGGIFGTAG